MKYKCLLCGAIVGPTIKEKNHHLLTNHLKYLSKRKINFAQARLVYFKPNDIETNVTESTKEDVFTNISTENQQEKKVTSNKNKDIGHTKRVWGMNPKKIRKIIRGVRGKRIDSFHVCSCCKIIHEHNWKYEVEGFQPVFLCDKCHDLVKLAPTHFSLVYNAFETNRRKH